MNIRLSHGISNISPIILLVVYQTLSFFSVDNNFAIDALLMLLIIFSYSKSFQIKNILLFLFLFIIIITRYLFCHSSTIGYFAPIHHCTKYLNLLIGIFLSEMIGNLEKKQKKTVLSTVLICTIVTDIISVWYCIKNPLAIRYREFFGDHYPGIITFSSIFAFGLLAVLLIVIIIDNKIKKLDRVFLILLAMFSNVIMLLASNLTTPILLFLVMLAIYIVYKNYRDHKILTIVFSFVFVALLAMKDTILELVYNVLLKYDESFVATRLKAIISVLLRSGAETTTLDNRMEKYSISLNTFKNNPIFGAGFKNFDMNTIGCHQDWPDVLAVSGIVGLILLAIFLFIQFKHCYKKIAKAKIDRICLTISFIYILLLGILDPFMEISIMLIAFGFAPNISCFMKDGEIENA